MKISPGTALCGIVLHPASHTRSPAMHNAAYLKLEIDAVYLAFDVAPQQLAGAMTGFRDLGIRQLSVSIPHKLNVMAHLDEVDDTARRIGAVNTVTWHEGRLRGTNTDWLGAMRALERETRLEGTRAVVLGAGGTARALVYGLVARGAEVTVLNRTLDKARALAEGLGAADAGELADLKRIPHDLLVNTTSVGLGDDASPVDPAGLRPDSVVMDVVYEPATTRLLREAAACGARIVTGKWMLVLQAVAQLEAWRPEARRDDASLIDAMAKAFDEAGDETQA